MSVAVWYRQDAGWLVSARVVETGEFMIFWPVILTMLKLRGGRLADSALTDFAIKSAVRLPCQPRPRTTDIMDAFVGAGLLVREASGDWTTPNWDEYQPDRRPNSRSRGPQDGEHGPTLGQPVRPRASQCVPGTAGDSQGVPAGAGYGTGRDGTERPASTVVELSDPGPDTTERPVEPAEALPPTPPEETAPDPLRSKAELVFRHWVVACKKNGVAAKLSSAAGKKRIGVIVARLRDGYTVEQLKAAVDGCTRSPFHQGENDRGQVYDDLELICRADKVDRFIQIAQQPQAQRPPPEEQAPTVLRRTGNTDPIPEQNVWAYRNRKAAEAAAAGSGR